MHKNDVHNTTFYLFALAGMIPINFDKERV